MESEVSVIEAIGLSKRLPEKQILRRIDLRLHSGDCLVIIGDNGSGKTTLLRCLMGALRPDDGRLLWNGQPMNGSPSQRRAIGCVAHESQLYAHLTVYENLLFAARMHDVARPARRVISVLNEAGLVDLARETPHQISRGQRQRLSIARAIVHEPDVLVLDEPCTGLDAAGRAWLIRTIVRLRHGGGAAVMTTHDVDVVRRLATRVVLLRDGELTESTIDLHEMGPVAA